MSEAHHSPAPFLHITQQLDPIAKLVSSQAAFLLWVGRRIPQTSAAAFGIITTQIHHQYHKIVRNSYWIFLVSPALIPPFLLDSAAYQERPLGY